MDLKSAFLGWLLGMLSPVIVSRIQRKYTKKDLHVGIINELRSIRYRLVCTAHLLCAQYGNYDKNFLQWCVANIEGTEQEEGSKEVLKMLQKQIQLQDAEFAPLVNALRAKTGVGKSLKKADLAFSEMHLNDLSLFSIKFQSMLFDLKAKLAHYNDEVEKSEKYHMMTFDSSLSPENHQIVKSEISSKYEIITGMTMRAVDKITEIIKCTAY